MIPVMAVLQVRRPPRHNVKLWLPLFLLWLVLLPVVVLFLPLALIGLIVAGVSPFRACSAFWQILTGLRNTHIEIERGDRAFLLRII